MDMGQRKVAKTTASGGSVKMMHNRPTKKGSRHMKNIKNSGYPARS